MPSVRSTPRAFVCLLLAAAILLALIVRPIASALFLAAVAAGVLWPLHRRLFRCLRDRRGVSTAIILFGVILLLLGPVVALMAVAITEGADGLNFLSETLRSEGMAGVVNRLPQPIAQLARQALEQLSAHYNTDLGRSIQEQIAAQGGHAVLVVGATLSATGVFAFQTAMMLIALYFFLLQGDLLVAWLDELSPLEPGQTRELLTEFRRVSFAVVLSTVVTAAAQAAVALVGYLIARVPHALFFTGMTFFVAFIPAIGAAAVCLVAALLLLATGHPYAAAFLSIWGVAVVGLVDNLVKPLLIRTGMHMNASVVFFSLIGGLSAFGGVGLLLGPLTVALFLALLRMYRRDFNPAQPELPIHESR